MIDVTAVGELLIDFVTKSTDKAGYPTMAANPGGAPCNFLAALTKYGCHTAFLGKVGADAFGNRLIKTLSDTGIDTRGVVQSSQFFTTLAFVTLDASGDREFSFARKPGADTMLTYEECDLSLIDQAKVFHFGTLSLTDEPARTTTQRLVSYAKARGKFITFDPNLRAPLWDDLARAREAMLWGLAQADMVKFSDEEVHFLWSCTPEAAVNKLINEYGVRLAFVTLGAKGCVFATKRLQGTATCPKVHPVDTTGAGDIFGGSAVSQLLKYGKTPEELTQDDLMDISSFACAAASLSTERFGGISSVCEEAAVRAAIVS